MSFFYPPPGLRVGARTSRASRGAIQLGVAVVVATVSACTGQIGDRPAPPERPTLGPPLADDTPSPPPSWIAGESDPGPSLVRRLTRDEVLATITDTLGVRFAPGEIDGLPPETSVDGFRNAAVGLVATIDHVVGFRHLASRVVTALGDDGLDALVARHAPGCGGGAHLTPSASCAEDLVASLGASLFRRPVTPRETAAFAALVHDVAPAEGLRFRAGAGLVVSAMLQAPPFLYRLEDQRDGGEGPSPPGDGGRLPSRPVTGPELGVRLAYFLWGTAPDERLREAAAAGALDDPSTLRDQVVRMVDDPDRGPRGVASFVDDWLGLHRLSGIARPDLDPGLAMDLRDAAIATWRDIVWTRSRPLVAALDDETAMLSLDLAEAWYGLPGRGGDTPKHPVSRYATMDLHERVGILTHPGVLTVMSDRDVGGIVARGLYLLERVLCAEPVDPPPDLDLSAFRSHLGADATPREYSEDRLASDACASCHRQFDPLAHALDRFDGLGRYAPVDERGRWVRWDGELPREDTIAEPFDDVDGYAHLLADDPRVARCLTEKHLQYALGRALEPDDQPWVDAIHEAAMAGGGTYAALAVAIATHGIFRTVRIER